MAKEQDPIRDALSQIAADLKAPNPLEVLGITTELARELQPDALLLAAKGLYRAHQVQLHPDKADVVPAQAEKLQRIQEAYDKVSEGDIDSLRAQMLKPKKRNSRLTAAEREAAKAIQVERSETENVSRSIRKSADYIDGLFSDESLRRIKRGFALIRPISLLKQDSSLPMQSLVIDGSHLILDNLIRDDSYEIPFDLGIPKDALHADFYVENNRALVRDNDGRLTWQKINLPDGWHLVHGIGENRDMMSLILPRKRSRFDLELAGCIEEDVVKGEMKKFLATGSNNLQYKLAELANAPETAAVPAKFRDRFLIRDGWKRFVLNGEETGGPLVPKLIPGQVLTARSGENDLLVIGRVDQAMAHYLGE